MQDLRNQEIPPGVSFGDDGENQSCKFARPKGSRHEEKGSLDFLPLHRSFFFP